MKNFRDYVHAAAQAVFIEQFNKGVAIFDSASCTVTANWLGDTPIQIVARSLAAGDIAVNVLLHEPLNDTQRTINDSAAFKELVASFSNSWGLSFRFKDLAAVWNTAVQEAVVALQDPALREKVLNKSTEFERISLSAIGSK